MHQYTTRRQFIAASASTTLGVLAFAKSGLAAEPVPVKPLSIGVIGLGGRGRSQINYCHKLGNISIKAACDTNPESINQTKALFQKYGSGQPEFYDRGPEDYKRLLEREDLDAVIISTPWELHAPMAVAAMKAGKHVGVEVPLGLTIDEIWDVVNTSEATGRHCMMFENWSFRPDNLAVLRMIREGLFGEIVHARGSYSHNCIHWFFDQQGEPRWSGRHLIDKNVAQYCTHGMGPIPGWLDLNRGDRVDYLVAMASKPKGINDQLARKHGPDHKWAKQTYKQGDIVTVMMRTVAGKTIVMDCDVVLPRPYDNRWMLQGTRGIYNEQRSAVSLEGTSPQSQTWEPFAPYEQKYTHPFWQNVDPKAAGSHGGTDYVVMREFVRSLRQGTPPPLDVYDSAVISMVNPLSGESIAKGSMPVKCPDFTKGAWKTNKPSFGI